MAITNYTNLRLTVAQFMNRADLDTVPAGNTTSPIQDMIVLTEAKIKRKLRRSTVQATISITADQNLLPNDVAELRSIALQTGFPKANVDLKMTTPTVLNDVYSYWGNTASVPSHAAVLSGAPPLTLLVAPTPDAVYPALITYYQQLTPLSVANPTNFILQENPDLYLYGTLTTAEPYMQNDSRMPLWKSLFDEAVEDLEKVKDREEAGAGLRPVRLPYKGFEG